MPCSSDGYPPSEREIWHAMAFPAACEMSRLLTKAQLNRLSEKTLKCIAAHEKYDREQAAEKKREEELTEAKRSALSKLTEAEKKALRL